jgi:hypothetical protein
MIQILGWFPAGQTLKTKFGGWERVQILEAKGDLHLNLVYSRHCFASFWRPSRAGAAESYHRAGGQNLPLNQDHMAA